MHLISPPPLLTVVKAGPRRHTYTCPSPLIAIRLSRRRCVNAIDCILLRLYLLFFNIVFCSIVVNIFVVVIAVVGIAVSYTCAPVVVLVSAAVVVVVVVVVVVALFCLSCQYNADKVSSTSTAVVVLTLKSKIYTKPSLEHTANIHGLYKLKRIHVNVHNTGKIPIAIDGGKISHWRTGFRCLSLYSLTRPSLPAVRNISLYI